MKKLYVALLVACYIIVFMVGMTVGMLRFSRVKVLGKDELQEHIYEETNKIIDLFKDSGFKVNQSHIIGIMWVQQEKLGNFLLLARALEVDTIYVHWKTSFLNQPVFYIISGETTITYEPF